MAIFNSDNLTRIRQDCAKVFGSVAYTKPQINAALQAIEDTIVTRPIAVDNVTKTIPQLVAAAIDVVTTPFIFTTPQKKLLFALWARLKFEEES